MSQKKPIPIGDETPAKKVCPVCGEPSYSAAGIHPQCAIVQADAPRNELIKAERKVEAESKKSEPAKPARSWKKTCPKCKSELHVRKKLCHCGHNFSE
jgi:hypothetical protein